MLGIRSKSIFCYDKLKVGFGLFIGVKPKFRKMSHSKTKDWCKEDASKNPAPIPGVCFNGN